MENVAIRNTLGAVLAIPTYVAATYVLSFVIGLLSRAPFLMSLLSFPSTPQLYLSILLNCGVVFCTIWVTQVVCLPNEKGRKIGVIFVAVALVVIGAITTILTFTYNGWSDGLVGMIFGTISPVFAITSSDIHSATKK